MARLGPNEVYRAICEVDLGPILPLLPYLPFFTANPGGGDNPRRYSCDVVLQSQFPSELKQFVADLPLGGRTARVLLRRLGFRQSIPPHVDAWMPGEANWRRFQLPITTHPMIEMRWPDDGVSVHLLPGTLYEVRFDRTHEVVHPVDCERVHLQIDQVDATI